MIDAKELRLRWIEDDDHEFLVSLHNDPLVLKNITHPEPISMEQHLAWWERIRNDDKQKRMLFCVDGERAGLAKFYDIDRTNSSCSLGADLHESFRGQGLAKYMWNLMLNLCFFSLQLHRVSLTTAEYNYVGRRVYENLGFKEEGKLTQSLFRDGKYYDQIMMYMLQEDWFKAKGLD